MRQNLLEVMNILSLLLLASVQGNIKNNVLQVARGVAESGWFGWSARSLNSRNQSILMRGGGRSRPII